MSKRAKRHSASEIAAKLDQAAVFAAQGQTQGEIAKALGVSVMTFHRWRKAFPRPPQPTTNLPSANTRGSTARGASPEQQSRIAQLQMENTRLRKLVTDLLLEKMRLEDELPRSATNHTLKKPDGRSEV